MKPSRDERFPPRVDKFPADHSLASCAPAEPASAGSRASFCSFRRRLFNRKSAFGEQCLNWLCHARGQSCLDRGLLSKRVPDQALRIEFPPGGEDRECRNSIGRSSRPPLASGSSYNPGFLRRAHLRQVGHRHRLLRRRDCRGPAQVGEGLRLTVTVSCTSGLSCVHGLLGYNDGGADGKHL